MITLNRPPSRDHLRRSRSSCSLRTYFKLNLLKTYSNFTCEQAEQIVVQFKDAQLWENVVSQRAHLEFYHGNF